MTDEWRDIPEWPYRICDDGTIARHTLTADAANQLRIEFAALRAATGGKKSRLGNGKLAVLCEKYGVSPTTVFDVVNFRLWRPFSRVPERAEAPK